jgi:hypothetical protein
MDAGAGGLGACPSAGPATVFLGEVCKLHGTDLALFSLSSSAIAVHRADFGRQDETLKVVALATGYQASPLVSAAHTNR